MKTYKVRIIQPIVPEYRKALFDGLAEKYGDAIDIVAAASSGRDVSVPLEKMRYDYSHSFIRIGPFLWQKGLSLAGLSRGDVIVVCGDIHNLSALLMVACARLKGIRIVWWGHHVSAMADERRVWIRLFIARFLADVYLCYTDAGISYLLSHGFKAGRVFATGNTIDLKAVQRGKDKWDGVRKFGEKKTLLFCGVLREKVRVDVLLKSLKILSGKRNDLHCVVIGSGEMEAAWKNMAKEMGIDSQVTWTGEIRGQDKLAPWFLSADLFVYPGRIGLSIIHAFSFGLPVVLNDNKNNHGPEYEAFKPGENGWSFRENDEIDLARQIEAALHDPDLRLKGTCGESYVFGNYSMERMIERTTEAIEAAAKVLRKDSKK